MAISKFIRHLAQTLRSTYYWPCGLPPRAILHFYKFISRGDYNKLHDVFNARARPSQISDPQINIFYADDSLQYCRTPQCDATLSVDYIHTAKVCEINYCARKIAKHTFGFLVWSPANKCISIYSNLGRVSWNKSRVRPGPDHYGLYSNIVLSVFSIEVSRSRLYRTNGIRAIEILPLDNLSR